MINHDCDLFIALWLHKRIVKIRSTVVWNWYWKQELGIDFTRIEIGTRINKIITYNYYHFICVLVMHHSLFWLNTIQMFIR